MAKEVSGEEVHSGPDIQKLNRVLTAIHLIMPYSHQTLWRFAVIRSSKWNTFLTDKLSYMVKYKISDMLFVERFGAWCRTCAGGCSMIWLTTATMGQSSRDDILAHILCHEISHAICAHADEARALKDSKASAQKMEELNWKHEYEADEVGMRLSARAGYNPYAAVLYFKLRSGRKEKVGPLGENSYPSVRLSIYHTPSKQWHTLIIFKFAQRFAKLQSGIPEALEEYEESNKQNTLIAEWQKKERHWQNPFHNYPFP
jgi:hypothetical protein